MRTKEKGAMQKQRRAVKADACSGCEQCMELCPYEVSIPEMLTSGHHVLG